MLTALATSTVPVPGTIHAHGSLEYYYGSSTYRTVVGSYSDTVCVQYTMNTGVYAGGRLAALASAGADWLAVQS